MINKTLPVHLPDRTHDELPRFCRPISLIFEGAIMRLTPMMKRAAGLLVVFACWAGPLIGPGPGKTYAEDVSPEVRSAILSGADLERSQKWLDAIDHYEKTLKGWPENKSLQYGLRRSKIHFGIESFSG
jgi:hypothetical protein